MCAVSEENKKQLLIPRGFGHGFVTLTDDVEFLYKADNYYAPEADGGISGANTSKQCIPNLLLLFQGWN